MAETGLLMDQMHFCLPTNSIKTLEKTPLFVFSTESMSLTRQWWLGVPELFLLDFHELELECLVRQTLSKTSRMCSNSQYSKFQCLSIL